MAVRESKRALAEAAELLDTDTRNARLYLRRVQGIAGPIPYGTIVTAMRRTDVSQIEAVAAMAAEMALQDMPPGSPAG
jgi:hypothetical protein